MQLVGVWTQAPAPSQCPTGVKVEPVQEVAPQLVVVEALRHAPAPLQVPLKPQGGLAVQPLCGSISPSATGLQRPARPGTLHD
jgi:hypothetical protein